MAIDEKRLREIESGARLCIAADVAGPVEHDIVWVCAEVRRLSAIAEAAEGLYVALARPDQISHTTTAADMKQRALDVYRAATAGREKLVAVEEGDWKVLR